jgi:hypothetical protein
MRYIEYIHGGRACQVIEHDVTWKSIAFIYWAYTHYILGIYTMVFYPCVFGKKTFYFLVIFHFLPLYYLTKVKISLYI